MAASESAIEARRPWIYAFLILLAASLWVLTMRLINTPFLALDFEVSLIYIPTILAGIIVFQMWRKRRETLSARTPYERTCDFQRPESGSSVTEEKARLWS